MEAHRAATILFACETPQLRDAGSFARTLATAEGTLVGVIALEEFEAALREPLALDVHPKVALIALHHLHLVGAVQPWNSAARARTRCQIERP